MATEQNAPIQERRERVFPDLTAALLSLSVAGRSLSVAVAGIAEALRAARGEATR